MIRGAAGGRRPARDELARRYLPAVESYLRARWRGTPLLDDVDDAVQEVFLDLFREDGALARADPERGGFRPFLYGVLRIVALRFEERRGRRRAVQPSTGFDVADEDEPGLSTVFDQAWATLIMREAGDLHARRAREQGGDALRRLDLLRLRFNEDLPIREIARRWKTDPDRLHTAYARARREFRRALGDTVFFHHPGEPEEVEAECARLIELFG
jgi:RNA polymerase sigma-70 factor (ECF subfamily)